MERECIDFNALVDYIAGNLPDKVRDRMMEHISRCDKCLENIASVTRIMQDSGLDVWEPMSEKEARIVLERVNKHLLKRLPRREGVKPESVKRKFLEWVKGLTPDFSLEYGFARSPGLSGDPCTDHICIKEVFFDDLNTDMFVERDNDKFCIQIKVHKDNEMAKNVRLTLKRHGASTVSRLASDGYELFEGLPFGNYELALSQKLLEKGYYSFEIGEEGINEK